MDRNLQGDPHFRVLQERLGRPLWTTGDEVRFNSPFAPPGGKKDRKHHLYINFRKGSFFDFRTSSSGSLSYLFRLLGEEFTDSPELAPPPVNEIRERIDKLQYALPRWELPRAELPPSKPVITGSDVHLYLNGRGVTNDDIAFWKIREGEDEYEGWAIVPSYDLYNRVDYWVARRTYEDAPSWEPKYDNPKTPRKYHVAFLSQAIAAGQGDVILCEGVFSAIVAGRSSCASLGKFVTNNQIALLRNSGVKTVRLALDGDAWKETLDTANRCLRLGLRVTVIHMPVDQDPADMGRYYFYEYVREHEREMTLPELFRLRLETL